MRCCFSFPHASSKCCSSFCSRSSVGRGGPGAVGWCDRSGRRQLSHGFVVVQGESRKFPRSPLQISVRSSPRGAHASGPGPETSTPATVASYNHLSATISDRRRGSLFRNWDSPAPSSASPTRSRPAPKGTALVRTPTGRDPRILRASYATPSRHRAKRIPASRRARATAAIRLPRRVMIALAHPRNAAVSLDLDRRMHTTPLRPAASAFGCCPP